MVVNYKYGDLFKKDTVDKQLSIVSDDGKINITNTELHLSLIHISIKLLFRICKSERVT